ncbi:MAG: 50S ribosomal protein L31 [Deltaproteobacteria bacterium]|nr:50S ribosomal protein L31 [Deltaproteobacteria bacterium]
MKQGIHPTYTGSTVTCACGNVIETASTRGDFRVDICSACHPFFTGREREVRATGRVEKFNKRYGKKK